MDRPLLLIIEIERTLEFWRRLVGSGPDPNAAQREQIASLKTLVFEGLTGAVELGLPKSQAGAWTDTDLGQSVLLRSRAMSLLTIAALESATGEQDVELLNAAAALGARYASIKLSYDPQKPRGEREEKLEHLRRLNGKGRSAGCELLFEIGASPSAVQVGEHGDIETSRVFVVNETIRQLQDGGVDPGGWVVESPRSPKAAAVIGAQAHLDDRERVNVLFTIGAGKRDETAEEAVAADVKLAARTPGVDGIIVGGTIYGSVLAQVSRGEIQRDEAVRQISERLTDLWQSSTEARSTSDVK